MSEFDIIRAWKDPEYRASLSEAKLEQLPENPAGLVELPDRALMNVAGGEGNQPHNTEAMMTFGCNGDCDGPTDNTYCTPSCHNCPGPGPMTSTSNPCRPW